MEIGGIPFFSEKRIVDIEEIETRFGGNWLVRVVTGDGVYALRQSRRGEGDVANEYRVAQLAGRAGIAPEVLWYDEVSATMVQEWIDGEHRSPLDETDRRVLADTLRTLHTYTPQGERFPMIDLPALIKPDTSEVVDAFQTIGRFPVMRTLCHNDLNPRNVLWQDGRVWLIDFEYAGLNDPCFDLAAVSVEFGLSEGEERAWMEAYWGEEMWDKQKLAAYKVLYRALCRQWEAKQG